MIHGAATTACALHRYYDTQGIALHVQISTGRIYACRHRQISSNTLRSNLQSQ